MQLFILFIDLYIITIINKLNKKYLSRHQLNGPESANERCLNVIERLAPGSARPLLRAARLPLASCKCFHVATYILGRFVSIRFV